MVCQDNMKQVVQDRLIQPVYMLRAFLYILHAENNVSNHAARRREPCAWEFLEFFQLADVVQERTRKNKMCIAWVEVSEALSDGCNIYRVFKQAPGNGSMVSYSSRPAAKASYHFGCEAMVQ